MKNLASIVTKESVKNALEKVITQKPILISSTKYLLKYKGQTFPPKEIVRLAAKEQGIKESQFHNYRLHGGQPTNKYLQKLGFEIIQFADWKISKPASQNRLFIFKSGRASKTLRSKSFYQQERLVQPKKLHDKIQSLLYDNLVNLYGEKNVGMENETGRRTKIDITLRLNKKIVLYEVKSYSNVSDTIRESIGQLLEYAYQPNPIKNLKEMIIVSHKPILRFEIEYLQAIRRITKLKLYYQQFDLKEKTLSGKF